MALDSAALRCAHIKTLAELVVALKDPSQPLVFDLGGRSFTPTGPAVRPRAPPVVFRRSKSDNCPAIPNGHAALDCVPSGRLACASDSRYAEEWRMDEDGSFCSSSAESVNPSRSPSIDSVDRAHTVGQQRGNHSRRASRAPVQAQRDRVQGETTPAENTAAAADRDIDMHPAAREGPESWISQSTDGHASEDTGDDARVTGSTDFYLTNQSIAAVHRMPRNTEEAEDLARGGILWPMFDACEEATSPSTAPIEEEGPDHVDAWATDDWHVVQHGQTLPPDSAYLEDEETDNREDGQNIIYLDIVRPGTVLCNGSIEVPESTMLRVLTSCTLKNLSLRGPGVPEEQYWGYRYPALVTVGWPGMPHIHVHADNVKIKRVAHSNGFKGPDAHVALKQCTMAHNEASGLWVVAGGTVTAEGCEFQDNKCNGAAAWDVRSSIAARACSFRRNTANGLRLLYGASGSLLACTVASNQDQGIEAGEAATRLRIDDSVITCNNNFALKSYQRASVFLKNTMINRGQPRAHSIHAQGTDTHVHTLNCMIDGQSTFMSHAIHTQHPQPQQG